MDSAWHFVHQGQPQGPVDGAGLVALAADGIVTAQTPVWRQGQGEWVPFSHVQELAAALQQMEEQEPAAKRQRLGGVGAGPPSPKLQAEVPAWLDALDEDSTMALFEKALFHHLADAIRAQPELRDQLLSAYVRRHPASDDNDPANYAFTDAFLLEAVEDFNSREQMWKVLGEGNAAAVRSLIAAAARMDRRYCSQLYSLALLSRARRLIDAGDGQGLLGMLKDEEEGQNLASARDWEGRTLWHNLVEGEQAELLRLLLPAVAGPPTAAAAAAAPEAAGAGAAEVEAANGERQNGEQQQQQQGQHDKQQGQQQAQRRQVASCLNIADFSGSTPLHLAAESSQLEAARLLLDAGANPDMQNRDSSKYAGGDWSVKSKGLGDFAIPVPSLHQTPLHIAAEAGDLQLMGLLVQRGALLDLRDTAGSTPLHLALEAQDEHAVELLLQAGANPALANNDMGDESTPLHLAASQGKAGVLRLLLDTGKLAGAVSKPGEQGFTPLHLAARRGSAECVRLLLEAGADRQAVNAAGKTALDIARVNKREAVVALLEA